MGSGRMSRRMKWLVGSIAVLFAFVVGVAAGWTLRARQPVAVAPPMTTAAPVSPPPPPPTAVVTATPAARWIEDTETFSWPPTASADVVAVDATHYLVRRSFLEQQLAENRLAREARMVPAYEDGGAIGIKIFGVRPSSTMARFGLKNGDTLETFNGLPLASPDDALEAYTHVRTGTKFVLGLQRNGAHVDLHYRVV